MLVRRKILELVALGLGYALYLVALGVQFVFAFFGFFFLYAIRNAGETSFPPAALYILRENLFTGRVGEILIFLLQYEELFLGVFAIGTGLLFARVPIWKFAGWLEIRLFKVRSEEP